MREHRPLRSGHSNTLCLKPTQSGVKMRKLASANDGAKSCLDRAQRPRSNRQHDHWIVGDLPKCIDLQFVDACCCAFMFHPFVDEEGGDRCRRCPRIDLPSSDIQPCCRANVTIASNCDWWLP